MNNYSYDFYLGLIFILTTLTHLGLIYFLVYIKNKQFLSTNPKPNIVPYEQVKLISSFNPQIIRTGIDIQSFPIFDIKQNHFVLNCNVWFRYPKKLGYLENIDQFSFLNVNKISKGLKESRIEDNDIYLEYWVVLEFSCLIDHYLFPLNDHSIYLMLINESLDVNDFILEAFTEDLSISDNLKVDDWSLLSTTVESGCAEKSYQASQNKAFQPRVLYSLHLKKLSLRRFFILIMPLLLVTYISNFLQLPLIDNIDGINPLSLSIGCITTMLAYRYVTIRLSPNVGYQTFLTKVSNLCLIMVFYNFLTIIGSLMFFGKIQAETYGQFWFYASKPIILLALGYLLFWDKPLTHNKSTSSNYKKFLSSLPKINIAALNLMDISEIKHQNSRFNSSFLFALMHACSNRHQEIKPTLMAKREIYIFANQSSPDKLIAILADFIQQGILDKHLKLCHHDDVMIFNQNRLTDIKSIFQLLLIECLLILKNPNQVYLLQDKQAINLFWQNHFIETKARRWKKLYQEAALNLVIHFFNKLSTYIEISNPEYPIFISHHDVKTHSTTSSIHVHQINHNHVMAQDSSFWLIPDVEGLKRWYLNDSAYLKINGKKPQIACLQQETTTKYYDLLSSQVLNKTTHHKKIKTYTFYSTMDFEQSSQSISKNVYFGLLNQFSALPKLNSQVDIFIKNDGYQPIKASQNIQYFINHTKGIPKILCPTGTPTLEYYQEHIEQQKLLVLFPISGGSLLRHSRFDNIIYFRASFINEAKMLISFIKHQRNANRLAIFYQNDSYGNGAVNGIKSELEALDLAWQGFSYQRNNPNIALSAKNINQYSPDSLLFISTYAPSYALIQALDFDLVNQLNLIAISYAANNLQDYLESRGLELLRTHLVPPLDANLEIVESYLESTKRMSFPNFPCDEGLEGYIVGDLIKQMLLETNFSHDPEEIKAYFRQIKQQQYKGLLLNFNAQTQELHSSIWLSANAKNKSMILNYTSSTPPESA